MRNNILYLLNHKTLTDFEVPILINKNFGVYIPKKYDSLNIVHSIAFNSIYSYDYSLKNISENDINFINKIDFFNIDHIKNNNKLMDIINYNFKIIFITLLNYESITYLSKNFNGLIYFRFFGLDGKNSYYFQMKKIGIIPEELCKNVKYIFSYQEIIEFEMTQNNFFNDENSYYIPLGLPNSIFDNYENTYNNDRDKFVFVCSKINICSYYTAIYNNFNNFIDKNNFDFIILGKNNEKIQDKDNRILNNLSDKEYYLHMAKSKAMYYHSKEPLHLHYHPLEAIIIGLPVIFHSENLLSSYLFNSPGMCKTDNEAIEKLNRIKNNDFEFINSIIEYQNIIKNKLKIENNINIFDNLLSDFYKNTSQEIMPCLGIGDIFIEFFKAQSNNIHISKITIANFILKSYRKTPENALKNLLNLINLLFDNIKIDIDESLYNNFQLKKLDINKYPIRNQYIYNLIKHKLPFINIEYKNYIIFHTKVRLFPYQNIFNYYNLRIINNFLNNFKTEKTIILCGERKIEENFECKALNIISLYENLLILKNNNNVIDLTYNELYSGQEDFNNFLYDVELINKADSNINFGIGGTFSIIYAFSKKNLCYLSKMFDHLKSEETQTYNVVYSYHKTNRTYNNIYNFINKIDDKYSITPRNYLSQYKTQQNAYFVGHNGLGDNIINLSAVNYLSNFYNKIFFICKEINYNILKLLLSNIKNIEIISIDSENEFNNIQKIYNDVIKENDFFVSGVCHTGYIQSKITNPYLNNYLKDISENDDCYYKFIIDFYQDINLDLTIYYGFFDLPQNDLSLDLYNSIKDYKICFIYFEINDKQIYNYQNIVSNLDNTYIILNISNNFYELSKDINPEKYELAKQFINIDIIYYIDTILNCDKIIIKDSYLSTIIYPLFKNYKLNTRDVTIINTNTKNKINLE